MLILSCCSSPCTCCFAQYVSTWKVPGICWLLHVTLAVSESWDTYIRYVTYAKSELLMFEKDFHCLTQALWVIALQFLLPNSLCVPWLVNSVLLWAWTLFWNLQHNNSVSLISCYQPFFDLCFGRINWENHNASTPWPTVDSFICLFFSCHLTIKF